MAYGQKTKRLKHKQYCNKLNEDFENGPHKKRLFKKTVKSSQKKKKKEREKKINYKRKYYNHYKRNIIYSYNTVKEVP